MKIPCAFHDVSKKTLMDFSKNVIICTNITVYNVTYETRIPFYNETQIL